MKAIRKNHSKLFLKSINNFNLDKIIKQKEVDIVPVVGKPTNQYSID
jgi:hypothetical protein